MRARRSRPGFANWRNAVLQDTAAVTIDRERIEHGVTRRGTCAYDGHFARKLLKFFVDQSGAADRSPSLVDLAPAAQNELSLAVITQAPCLEQPWKSEFANRAKQLISVVDRGMCRNRDTQLGKQRFFRHAVLGHFERRARRAHPRQFLERRERAPGDIFPVKSEDIAA